MQHPQFYWWCGHVCMVANALLYFMSVLSLHPYSSYYKRAYAGSLVSYGIVIWKSIGFPKKFDMEFIRNENVQYFALAFYWYSYQPIIGKGLEEGRSMTLQYTDSHHETAMQLAAYVEVIGVMGQLVLGVASFQTSILALIVFAHFLRLRYYLSPYTRDAMHQTTAQLDQWLLPLANDSRRYAQIVSKIYSNAKGIIIRYGSASQTSNTTPSTRDRNTRLNRR
ncbi:hypothetical protein K492DRAFT_149094 [Lichtheimia hyalospora FSU 10163]|nr:hypothetical protein K492DRAFT_149094 [Lichtheimia hyalospora FSU 10163]